MHERMHPISQAGSGGGEGWLRAKLAGGLRRWDGDMGWERVGC